MTAFITKYRFLFLSFLVFCLSTVVAYSQTNDKIKQLEKQRNSLQSQISESEALLQSTGKDIRSQLNNLSLLEAQIAERRKYINLLNNDIKAIDAEIRKIDSDIKKLEDELLVTKQRYAKSLRYMRSNRGIYSKLLFIFSAESFQHMVRRMRYLEEYATYQKLQGEQIIKHQNELKAKKAEKTQALESKQKVLKDREEEQKKLEEQEMQQKELINSLKKKQSAINREIQSQRKKAEKLNREIDRLIQIEIEKARKRQEEERRAREAAERNKRSGTSSSSGENVERMDEYKQNKEDRVLSSNFVKNKGILPMPVTGGYVIVNHFGKYNVPGLKNVQLDNKGIDIQTKPDAMARSIFKGEVSAVFEYAGLKGVLIRHGDYISVYCNLSSVLVKQGDKVDVKQAIGKIYTNKNDGNRTILHFQLRKETVKLNPEEWLDD